MDKKNDGSILAPACGMPSTKQSHINLQVTQARIQTQFEQHMQRQGAVRINPTLLILELGEISYDNDAGAVFYLQRLAMAVSDQYMHWEDSIPKFQEAIRKRSDNEENCQKDMK